MITYIVFTLADYAISFLIWTIILWAILSTLLSLNIIDRRNQYVWSVNDFLARVSEPVVRPIRRRVPTFNGVDLSPWIAVVLLQVVVRTVLAYLHRGIATGDWNGFF